MLMNEESDRKRADRGKGYVISGCFQQKAFFFHSYFAENYCSWLPHI